MDLLSRTDASRQLSWTLFPTITEEQMIEKIRELTSPGISDSHRPVHLAGAGADGHSGYCKTSLGGRLLRPKLGRGKC